MSGAAMAELIRTLAGSDEASLPAWWAARCASVLGVDGLAVTLAPEGSASELVLFSEPFTARMEDLQYTLGEGPTREATRHSSPFLEPDLAVSEWQWPMFTPAAMDAGLRAVFAFPMRLGAIRVGAMTCYRRSIGPVGRQVFLDALALADALTLFMVTVHLPSAPLPAPTSGPERPGAGAPKPELCGPVGQVGWVDLHRAQVHQAAGMLAVDLRVSIVTALVRLRAVAYAQDRPILEVAQDILERRLRLSPDAAPCADKRPRRS